MKKQASKQYSILQRYPEPVLNSTTINHLGNTTEPIEVFPPEIFFKDIEPNQNYEVTVTVRNISKRVRRLKFLSPKTSKFQIEHDMQGPLAAGLAIKMNVSFETDKEGDFHDVVEIQCEGYDQKFQLFLHALQPAADVQFEPLVNFRFIPNKTTRHEEIEFKNEGRIAGSVELEIDQLKGEGLQVEPSYFTIEPDEIKRVRVSLTANEADIITRLIHVNMENQEKPRTIEITATSVEQHLSIVFEEGGGQKSSLNFGTLYFGERREYPAFLVNNGPQPAQFSLRFLEGLKNLDQDYPETADREISPADAGKELCERVMTAEPLQGTVGPYSQVPLNFICRTMKKEKKRGFTDDQVKKQLNKPPSRDGQSVDMSATSALQDKFTEELEPIKEECALAIVSIKNLQHDDLKVQMMARACYPDVKISKQQLHLGECATNDRRDFALTVTNRNDDLPLDFCFSKTSCFKAMPSKGKLLPGTPHTINISFEPKSLGHFNQEMILDILKGIYQIPLKLQGYCNATSQRQVGVRGPMARPADFQPQRKMLHEEAAEARTLPKRKAIVAQDKGSLMNSYGISRAVEAGNGHMVDKFFAIKDNKDQANKFLVEERLRRNKEDKYAKYHKQTGRFPPETWEEIAKDPNLGMDTEYPEPNMEKELAMGIDQLYVEKPIGKYEPMRTKMIGAKRDADADRIIKRKWKAEPQTQAEIRDCSIELTGEQLQKINAGPQQINFKTKFVKSSTTKSFNVVNDLRQHIYVRLLVDQYPELAQSTPLSQVIPPGQEAGFDIVFCSQTVKTFKFPITYYINDKPFNFQVLAQADPVVLDISKKLLKFDFDDDNMDMSVTETLTITNHGNANARFQWVIPQSGTFIPEPQRDEVPAGSFKQVKITFRPSGQKSEEEMLTLKIEDGANVDVKCVGIVNESRCSFIEKFIDFGSIPVGIPAKGATVQVRNHLRSTAIFHIENPHDEVKVRPMQGKILPEAKLMFSVDFESKREADFQSEIIIHIRGGKPLRLPIKAIVKVPELQLDCNELNFGGVTRGDSKELPLKIYNHSNIMAKLKLDIREYEEFEIQVAKNIVQEDDAVSEIMAAASEGEGDGFRDNFHDLDPDDNLDPVDEMEEDEDDDDDENGNRFVNIFLKPKHSPLELLVKYTPADVEDPRDFKLPLQLTGVAECPELDVQIKGCGIKPKFLLEPTTVNFKTKVIAKGSKPLPFHHDIQITNPDKNKINWHVNRQELEDSKVFQMNPVEGALEANAISTIRVTFNPLEAKEYSTKVNLYLDGANDPYLTVELKGEGADAKIYFDRREIILPCTPLDIPARATFYVYHNNGYENLELKPKIANEVGKLPVELRFPEGHNLGLTKPKVKIEAVFSSPKPLSFTTYIDFYDDDSNKFQIPISGTTDNSIFTVYSYIQRCRDELDFEVQPHKPIILKEDATSEKETRVTGLPPKPKTGGSSVITATANTLLGYNPVPINDLQDNCEYVCRWYNAILQSSNTLQQFPQDIVQNNGHQVFDLIQYLSGKRPPCQAQKAALTANSQNAKEYLRILIQQYEDLINYLKVNGAHLNTVRPEYLLSPGDYNKFLKLYPREENMKPKTIDRVWPYFAMDSWLTMFYQILKIYYLNRVTPKSFKALPGVPPPDNLVEPVMSKSNIYSVPETILLKWLTYHYNKVNPMHPRQIINFDYDLRDGIVFASLIKSHYGNCNALKDMEFAIPSDDQSRISENAKRVLAAVAEIGLQTHIRHTDIVNPSAREILLFVVQLYQGLPHYIPKATIEFPAVLGDLVTKNIELSNPSKNPISYFVKIDGCPDFTISCDTIKIEPGVQFNFPIQFQSRISQQVSSKVIFTNKKETNIQAAAMVFELVSNVYERNSVDTIQKSTKLYKSAQIDIDLHNPFQQDVIFNVQIIYEKNQPQKKGKKGDKKNDKGAAKEEKKSNAPEPFTCKYTEPVKIRRNASANIQILFLPFELGVHKCNVVFTDEAIGELQYTIIGKAELPEIMETFTADCNSEETYPFRKALNFKNDKLEQAKNQSMDKAAQQKQKELLAQQAQEAKAGKVIPQETKFFEIEISNPFFSGLSSITLYDQNKAGGGGKPRESKGRAGGGASDQQLAKDVSQDNVQNQNMLELTCNPTKPASYTCYVILKSLDRTDIRLYEYKLTAIPQKIKAQLEFKVPARGYVCQDIPIHNNSSQEWKVTAILEETPTAFGNRMFGLNRTSINVKKNGGTDQFTLKFSPPWICQVTGQLMLKNEATKEEYEYELKGVGEEPLAEDHIVLNCQAREKTTYTFDVKNFSDKQSKITVWTDLQNAEGVKEFTIDGGRDKSYKYELGITPLLGGIYTASITFQDQEERFQWWTVEVRTDSPKPEKTIELKANIRQAISAEISLYNPLSDPITFEVFYTGEGLLGDSAFSLEPKNSGTYNLIFSPLNAGEFQGTIGFLNEKVGEFWYDLKLSAEENPVVNLELLECELGKVASHPVILENPTGQELYLEFRNSNPTNFEIVPDKILLPAFESLRVEIQYQPTNLDIVESGNIVFENPLVGKWEYNVEGKGMLPTIMEPQPISTSVGNNTSSMLTFKNPFKEQSSVTVFMETDDTKIFQLLLKRNKFNIGPLGILQVPYSFSPQSMTESRATIVVQMSKQLVWKYPLMGVAESASTSIDYYFKTRARKPLDEKLRIQLPGFQDLSNADTFSYSVNVTNPAHKSFIDKSVLFEQKNERLYSHDDALNFVMRFEPLRPFKTTVEFVIYKSSGGRWKFNVVFEALEPEVDDVIVIQSPLHKTSSVSFRLNNHLKQYAEFQAFFTQDSAPEFQVMPKSGMLEPYGKDGTNFIISFTPTEYGKAKVGRLVIQTDEMQWTYEIRGSHPQYKIPEVGGGRIDRRLSKEVAQQIKAKHSAKKNFVKENLRTNVHRSRSPKKGGIQDNNLGAPSLANISQRQNSTGGRQRDLSQSNSKA